MYEHEIACVNLISCSKSTSKGAATEWAVCEVKGADGGFESTVVC